MKGSKKFEGLTIEKKTKLLFESVLELERSTDKKFNLIAGGFQRTDKNFKTLEGRCRP